MPRSSQPAGRRASRSQTVTAASRTAVHIVCLGEAKCRRYQNAEGLFTDQEKGHTVSFAEALVREQPWRAELLGGDALSFARVVTFITDSVHIVFFQCTFTVKLLGQLSVELSSLGGYRAGATRAYLRATRDYLAFSNNNMYILQERVKQRQAARVRVYQRGRRFRSGGLLELMGSSPPRVSFQNIFYPAHAFTHYRKDFRMAPLKASRSSAPAHAARARGSSVASGSSTSRRRHHSSSSAGEAHAESVLPSRASAAYTSRATCSMSCTGCAVGSDTLKVRALSTATGPYVKPNGRESLSTVVPTITAEHKSATKKAPLTVRKKFTGRGSRCT